MSRNTEEIVKLAKEKSIKTRKTVIATINKLKKDKEKINFSTVAKAANVSRNYLYNSAEFRPVIEDLRAEASNINLDDDTRDFIIQNQKEEIEQLKEELKIIKQVEE